MKKVIFLTTENPYALTHRAKHRNSQLVESLKERMNVEILCFGNSSTTQSVIAPENVKISEIPHRRAPLWKQALSVIIAKPGYSSEMADALRAKTADRTLLWVSGAEMMSYIPLARSLGYRVVLDTESGDTFSFFEARLRAQTDAIVAASDSDAARVSKQPFSHKSPVYVIPNSIDSIDYRHLSTQKGNALLFSGDLNEPSSVQGLRWFVTEIMPRMMAALGKTLPKIIVATETSLEKVPLEFLKLLQFSGIEIHPGTLTLLPLLGDAGIVFFPTRSGLPQTQKILEAMAAGRAVVSTGRGAGNLVLSPSYDILIADDADHFTSAIVRLLNNAQLRDEISAHAIQTVKTRYDSKHTRELLDNLLSHFSKEL